MTRRTTKQWVFVSEKRYHKQLEALDYIASYDVKRGPCHAKHLRDVARKALGRKK